MVKEMGVPDTLTKARNEYYARVLEKIGADRVAHPERDIGMRVAHNLVSRNILDYLGLSDKYFLAEARVSSPKFSNKTLSELDFRQHLDLTVAAIRRVDQMVIVSPAADEYVRENDNLLVVGETGDVDILDDKMNR